MALSLGLVYPSSEPHGADDGQLVQVKEHLHEIVKFENEEDRIEGLKIA